MIKIVCFMCLKEFLIEYRSQSSHVSQSKFGMRLTSSYCDPLVSIQVWPTLGRCFSRKRFQFWMIGGTWKHERRPQKVT